MTASSLNTVPTVRTVADNIGFTEGPVWTAAGRLYVTSVSRGMLYEIFLDGRRPKAIAETGGGPNGMTVDRDDALWVTQNGGRAMPTRSSLDTEPALQVWKPDMTIAQLVPTTKTLHSPSDCVCDHAGRIWFTDPDGHHFGDEARPGRVLRHDPLQGTTEVIADDVFFPNGIAFTPGERGLLVAETARDRITRFDLTGAHARRDPKFSLQVDTPDGIAVDALGGVWVAGSRSGCVSHFDANGTSMTQISIGVGTMPTSVCFAGHDLQTLVITVAKGGRVLALTTDTPGLPVPVRATASSSTHSIYEE